MNEQTRKQFQKLYADELSATIQFWLDHGMDAVNGGVYTCLDRKGDIYSTDKSVWMQGRCAYTFANLCENYGNKQEWLRAAASCIDFLNKYCINPQDGRMYFTVTAEGKPLRQRRYYFSETFYIMANAQYAHVSGDQAALQNARKYFDLVWRIYKDGTADPHQCPPKTIPETRNMRGLGPSMILLNVSGIMRKCDSEKADYYTACAGECIQTILTYHYKPEIKAIIESVGQNGEIMDQFSEGRIINPGHAIEACWFMLDEAQFLHDHSLVEKAKDFFDWSIQRGWDEEYGGILYFTDLKGCPPEQYEHDMKLWWPHNEAIIASLKLYLATGEARYETWFETLTNYAFSRFHDDEYGEWYGYLRRDGLPTQPASKGTTFKGPFHLQRMLITVDKLLSQMN